jgi:hypothetical protein
MFPPEGVSKAPCIVHEVAMTTPRTNTIGETLSKHDEHEDCPPVGSAVDPRYPFTHAYDFVRMQTREHSQEHDMTLPQFSRSQVACVCHAIAPTLGMTAEQLACKIADHARTTGANQ